MHHKITLQVTWKSLISSKGRNRKISLAASLHILCNGKTNNKENKEIDRNINIYIKCGTWNHLLMVFLVCLRMISPVLLLSAISGFLFFARQLIKHHNATSNQWFIAQFKVVECHIKKQWFQHFLTITLRSISFN